MDGALEFVVDVVRKVDADYDGFRKHLLKRLKVLDLIQELRTVEDLDQARLILRMAMQLDQVACDTEAIKRDVADTAKAARKRIEADALYSYKEATELVGVSEPTLRRDAKAGNLRKSMIRGAVRFGGNDLLVYLREKKTAIRVLGDGGKGK